MDFLPAELVENRSRRHLHGREHIVAPCVLIVPGVLTGNQGPLLYPADELAKNVDAWNEVPLTLGHPAGKEIPAEDILGIVRNPRTDSLGRLMGEAWFDVGRTQKRSPDLLASVSNGRQIELSTGLGTTNDPTPGKSDKGVPYDAIARNHLPHHLAVLPDSVGACSMADGCGVNRNETSKQGEPQMGLTKNERKGLMDSLVGGCCWDEVDRPTLNELTDDQIQRFVKNADRHDKLLAFSAASEFTDEAGSVHTWNADDKLWTSTIKPPEPTEEVVTNVLTSVQEADLAFAATVRQERLDADIAKITANESNQLTAQQIADMPPATRQAVVNSLPEKPNANYSGQAGAPPTKTLNQDDFPEFNLPCDRPAEPVAA